MAGYPHSGAFEEGFLQVSDLHRIYYAQYGNPEGKPVIFLHGGPGGGTSVRDTRYFQPSIYRVVLIDQRGAGKSTPLAETRENTTQLLIQDVETLRHKLGISRWHVVFGGSWGSTLSLAYAESHPEVCNSVVLRGVFLGEEWEFDWTLRGGGPAVLFPDAWEEFLEGLNEEERKNPISAYQKSLFGNDERFKADAATRWNKWELSISNLVAPDDVYSKLTPEHAGWNLQHAMIECHYFLNGCFLRDEKKLLNEKNINKLRALDGGLIRIVVFLEIGWKRWLTHPTTVHIVQGRYDVVCPPKAAWALHKALPSSKLTFTHAGHSANELTTEAKLIEICDELAKT